MTFLQGIIICPGEGARRTSVESGPDADQGVIGGYVEAVGLSVRGNRRLDLYMDREGWRFDLAPNRMTSSGHALRGVLLILATDTETGETVSMTAQEITETLNTVAGWVPWR